MLFTPQDRNILAEKSRNLLYRLFPGRLGEDVNDKSRFVYQGLMSDDFAKKKV